MKKFISIIITVAFLFNISYITVNANSNYDIEFVTHDMAQDFYSDAVFISDSVGEGFEYYASIKSKSVVAKLSFLTSKGFSVNYALKPIGENTPHPEYNGEKQLIWDSINQMGAKKVFLSLGINDMNPLGNRFVSKYKELIEKILEVNPDVEITVLSVSPIYIGSESGRLNNTYIKDSNRNLKLMLSQNGWNYLDINTPLLNNEGGLNEKLTYDKYVHLTTNCYTKVWEPIFKAYAKNHLLSANKIWIEDIDITVPVIDTCDIYSIPRFRSEPVQNIETDTEVHITGSTGNGFYRIDLGDEHEYYIPKTKALIKE